MSSLSDLATVLNNLKSDYISGTETASFAAEVIKVYESYLCSPFSPDVRAYFLTKFTEELIGAFKTSTILVTAEVSLPLNRSTNAMSTKS